MGDSFSILFNHRSFQHPAVSPGVLMVFWKDSDWKEWKWKCPLENQYKNTGQRVKGSNVSSRLMQGRGQLQRGNQCLRHRSTMAIGIGAL